MSDELAKAISTIIFPVLKPMGFRRHRRRDLIRAENGMVQRLHFAVSPWGTRTFEIIACVNLVAANAYPTLEPGLYIEGRYEALTRWQAEASAAIALNAILSVALPWFEAQRTLDGHASYLVETASEATHHQHFQCGIAMALDGKSAPARHHLREAIALYRADGRSWCEDFITQAEHLLGALDGAQATELLAAWYDANTKAHGLS